jgi:hypothetical protein
MVHFTTNKVKFELNHDDLYSGDIVTLLQRDYFPIDRPQAE